MQTTPVEVLHYVRRSHRWRKATMLKRNGNQYICKVEGISGTGSYHHSEIRFPLSAESKERNQDKCIGLYYYCSDYHTGQDDWRYGYLSQSRYRPGLMDSYLSDYIPNSNAREYYQKLVERFENDE